MTGAIKSLGYLGLNVSDPAGWHSLLVDIFALQRRRMDDAAVAHYKMDSWHHRLSLYEQSEDHIAYIGWEAVDAQALDQLSQRLKASGIEVSGLDADTCRERAVLAGIRFSDPVMGVINEVFCGATIESTQFAPARPMQGYATGEQGMGHIVLMTTRQEDAVAFYCDQLGFRVSDVMDFGGDAWGGHFRHVFLHCNARHHSLAIMSPPAGEDGAVNHFALTVNEFDDLGYAYDIVRERQVPVLMTLGRHVNDLGTSFYVANPSQSAIEMSWGGIEIGEDWVVKHYDDTKIWGHHLSLPPRPLS